MDSLTGRPVNLVELESASGVACGIKFNRETNQGERDLSGPIGACHRTIWMQDGLAGKARKLGVFSPV
jgi:hypothetical protein